MKRRAWLMLVAAAPLAAQAPASRWSDRFGGYLKDLASASRSYFTDQDWGDNLDRLRLTYEARYGEWFQAHIDYDNDLHQGNLIPLPDFALIRERQAGAWLDLQGTVVDKKHFYWDTSLYRAWASFRGRSAALTLGRQRIGWGTARFFSPMDVFNPISPLAIEPNERPGVDAALLQVSSPGELRWNAVYLPQDGFRRSTSAVRLGRTIHNYDVDIASARFGEDWWTGADFAGQLRGAGLRGEVTYRWRRPLAGAFATRNALRFVLGADYAFVNTLYVVGEYFYNQGHPDVAPGRPIDPAILLRYSNEIFTLRRHFLSGGATYDLTPLWKLQGFTVVDLTGPSAGFLPRVTHSLSANADLNLGAELFVSSRAGEFHRLAPLAYAEFVLHFP